MKLSLLLLNGVSMVGLVAIATPTRANPNPTTPIAPPSTALPLMPPVVMSDMMPTPVATPVVNPVATPIVNPASSPVVAPIANTPDRVSSNEVKILSPTTQSVMSDRAATVVLQFSADQKVVLIVNGQPVDAKQVGRTENNNTTKQTTQTWYGVVLKEGDNVITANLLDANGTITSSTNALLQVRGAATKLKVTSQETRIPADGRSVATIAGELLDAAGNRSNRDGLVTLSANSGEFIGVDANLDQPGFQVKVENGQFIAKLRSSLEAKIVNILAKIGRAHV